MIKTHRTNGTTECPITIFLVAREDIIPINWCGGGVGVCRCNWKILDIVLGGDEGKNQRQGIALDFLVYFFVLENWSIPSLVSTPIYVPGGVPVGKPLK